MAAPVEFKNALYPFTGSMHEVNGFRMHVLDEGGAAATAGTAVAGQGGAACVAAVAAVAGAGAAAVADAARAGAAASALPVETIVMLHGNPTWSFFFRDLVQGLRATHRVIVPDHVGCGLSDKPNEKSYPYTLQRRVDDLAALIDQMQVKGRITLLMHDWGGMIGMAYAARFPDRINRVVLLNTAAFHLPKTKRLPLSLWLCRRTPLGELIIRDTALFISVLARWAVCRPMAQDVRAAYLWPYRLPDERTGLYHFVQDIPLNDGDPGYALVSEVQAALPQFNQKPCLICWGDKDFVFDHHFLREWQSLLPAAEVHRFADAGHYVLEDAGARILPLVQDFLARHPEHV